MNVNAKSSEPRTDIRCSVCGFPGWFRALPGTEPSEPMVLYCRACDPLIVRKDKANG